MSRPEAKLAGEFYIMSSREAAHIVKELKSQQNWHWKLGHEDPAAVNDLAYRPSDTGIYTFLESQIRFRVAAV